MTSQLSKLYIEIIFLKYSNARELCTAYREITDVNDILGST